MFKPPSAKVDIGSMRAPVVMPAMQIEQETGEGVCLHIDSNAQHHLCVVPQLKGANQNNGMYFYLL